MKKILERSHILKNFRIMRIIILLSFFTIVLTGSGFAQKINCKVRVNIDQMPQENQTKLAYLQEELETYINNYEWNEDEFNYDLNCELEIGFTDRQTVSYEDRYTATIILSNGIDLLYADKRCSFKLDQNERLMHSSAYHPFTALIDFYFNLVLAYEYDKLYELGGDKYYQICEEITINAKSVTQFYKGWDRRSDLVRELKGSNNKSFRLLMYNYFTGYYFFSQENDYEQAQLFLAKAANLLNKIPSEKLNRFIELNYANFRKALKRLKLNKEAGILDSVKSSVTESG